MQRNHAWIGLFLVICLSGCGRDSLGRHGISGSIKVDGAPLQEGIIRFEPTDGAATGGGAAVKNGKYSIEEEMGLPNGKYRVSVNAPKPGTGGTPPPADMPGDTVVPPDELIPPSWNMNSEQFIEVKPEGPFEFNFDIDTKKK